MKDTLGLRQLYIGTSPETFLTPLGQSFRAWGHGFRTVFLVFSPWHENIKEHQIVKWPGLELLYVQDDYLANMNEHNLLPQLWEDPGDIFIFAGLVELLEEETVLPKILDIIHRELKDKELVFITKNKVPALYEEFQLITEIREM